MQTPTRPVEQTDVQDRRGSSKLRVAVVQAASVMMDREATTARAVELIRRAADEGAYLVLFPEAFLSGYPRGETFGTMVGSRSGQGRKLWLQYWKSSVPVPGDTTKTLAKAAREAGVYLVMGIIERGQVPYDGTLYCSILYYGPDGTLLGKHRKLKPTGAERLIWGEGDGSTLTVVDTPFGKVGGLICWENYMPLARAALYAKGVHIYLAPTADARDSWQATLRHIALEGRCFVLGCNQYVEDSCRGGSAILSPLGEYVVEPVYDREEVIVADLDLDEVPASRFDFDVMGHYARPDVFELRVNEQPGSGPCCH